LGLLLHTASRRQLWRLPTAVTACSCLQLAVATNSPRKGLSPPIQCPCQAHLLDPACAPGGLARRSAPRNGPSVSPRNAPTGRRLRRDPRGRGPAVPQNP